MILCGHHCGMRGLISFFVWVCISSAALAQALPFHADPNAREDAEGLAPIPAIRFLTSTDFPPFNYRNAAGQLIGFHVDLAKAICTVLDVSCTVQAWPWEQVADALAGNQGDAFIGGLTLDDIATEQFDFSSFYLMLPGRFVMRADDLETFDPASLETIAVRKNSAHAKFLTNYFAEVEQVPFDTEIAALEATQQGRADVYFGDAMRASFWLNENIACCAFAGDAYFNPRFFGEGLAIALPAGRGDTRASINFALARLKQNGKLDELYLRWFPVSFY